jgi:hypothetical protein
MRQQCRAEKVKQCDRFRHIVITFTIKTLLGTVKACYKKPIPQREGRYGRRSPWLTNPSPAGGAKQQKDEERSVWFAAAIKRCRWLSLLTGARVAAAAARSQTPRLNICVAPAGEADGCLQNAARRKVITI